MSTDITFSAKQRAKYTLLRDVVITSRETAKEWVTALLEIKTTELYKVDCETWEEWRSKYVPWWSARTIEDFLKEERASLPKYIAEPVIRTKKKYTKKDKSTAHDTLTIHESSDNNKNNSHTKIVLDKDGKPPLKKTKVQDDMGTTIPEGVLEIWNRRHELQELMTAVSRVKCTIEEMRKREDPLFMKVSQHAIGVATTLYDYIERATPYCVCGECEGHPELKLEKVCGACHSTGFMSKEDYRQLIPEEKQTIRRKGIEFHAAKRLSA
jgi:hypothetical protein